MASTTMLADDWTIACSPPHWLIAEEKLPLGSLPLGTFLGFWVSAFCGDLFLALGDDGCHLLFASLDDVVAGV